jgi:hypothetical protein
MNVNTNEIRILLVAWVAFFLSLLYLVAALLPPCHLFYINYSFVGLSGGVLLLSFRRYNLRKDKKPIIKSKLVIRFIFPLLIILDCALFYAYFIADKIPLFDGIENIKEYYGLYLLIVSFWIGIILLLKNKR